MIGRWIAAVATIALLASPAASWAHGGHVHRVMGTVSNVEGNHLTVNATDGKTVMVMLDAKTEITRGEARATVADITVGDRVVAEGAEEKGMIMATKIQLGTAAPAATAERAPTTRAS